MRLSEIQESFNTLAPKQTVSSSPNGATVKTKIGNREIVYMVHIGKGFEDETVATIEFSEKALDGKTSTYDKTGSGNEMQVFAFVIDCVRDTIIDYSPDIIEFVAVKSDGNRGRLYKKLASKISGYTLRDVEDGRFEELFVFVRDK
jgi:hypothetical protein